MELTRQMAVLMALWERSQQLGKTRTSRLTERVKPPPQEELEELAQISKLIEEGEQEFRRLLDPAYAEEVRKKKAERLEERRNR